MLVYYFHLVISLNQEFKMHIFVNTLLILMKIFNLNQDSIIYNINRMFAY